MNYSNISDEDVVNIVKDGQIEAFGNLYDRYSRVIFNKCITFVESAGTAEELTYDIFLKAFNNLSKFNNHSPFRHWLYALTYSMCIDHSHKEYLHKKINYLDEEIDRIRIKVVHCDTEQRLLNMKVEQLKDILKKLPPVDRMILLMRYQDEMSIQEIQKQLQLNEITTKNYLHRACERAITIHDKSLQVV